jgi:hypothetical protein
LLVYAAGPRWSGRHAEKREQLVDQLLAAANHVESTLLLVFVQNTFQFLPWVLQHFFLLFAAYYTENETP